MKKNEAKICNCSTWRINKITFANKHLLAFFFDFNQMNRSVVKTFHIKYFAGTEETLE